MKKSLEFFTQMKQNQDNPCQTNVNVFEILKKVVSLILPVSYWYF